MAWLCFSSRNDTMHGGSGADTIYYVEGQDRIENCVVLNPPE